ncbi:SDR family NAD(P)-dependent oxidoreductase [Nakamurella flavida]|uniref:SDR family NAD(P)-dependent oxidoreductase n=1 Tax=Nakamurella flavida TaxID=363630 RepID=A0A939C6J9_9ACTN|nr:SDR family NAD(P)-dependent oxidoreductase [Nakamurella flavida]MBM9478169.1 SDR family NAD(P)-dependent oxidoreductase [Nakamurella flavida]MDP9778609.1 short-subunit dehydrogenase [Nakamurella flavida]
MTDLDGAHVLLVGATGGLGSALATAFAAAGARLSLAGRSAESLAALTDALPDGTVLGTSQGDLTDAATPARFVTEAGERGELTGVVYAAGVVAFGEVVDLPPEVLETLIAVNLVAPIRLAAAAVPVLPAGSFLVNLSAIVSEMPMKGMAAYSATKTGLTGFDRALSGELRRRNIRVVDARPPHTETGLVDRALAGTAPRLGQGLTAEAVAQRIVRAVKEDTGELPAAAFSAEG